MLTRMQARDLAANELNRVTQQKMELQADLTASGVSITPVIQDKGFELVLLNEREREIRSSFVFNYATRGLLETGDGKYQLYGGGPLLVDKVSGDVYSIGSGSWFHMGMEACFDRFDMEHDWLTQYSNGMKSLTDNHFDLAEDIFQSLLDRCKSAPTLVGISPLLKYEPAIELIPAILRQLARIYVSRGTPQKALSLLNRALGPIENQYVESKGERWQEQLVAILSEIVACLRTCGHDRTSEEFKLACCLYQIGEIRQSNEILESLYRNYQQGHFDDDAANQALVARICRAVAEAKWTLRDVHLAAKLFEESLCAWYHLLGPNPSRTLSISRGGGTDIAQAEKNFELTSKYGCEFGALLESYALFLKQNGDVKKAEALLIKSKAVRVPTSALGPAWLRHSPYCIVSANHYRPQFAMLRFNIEDARVELCDRLDRIRSLRNASIWRTASLGSSDTLLMLLRDQQRAKRDCTRFFPVCGENGSITVIQCDIELAPYSESETSCNWRFERRFTGVFTSDYTGLLREEQVIEAIDSTVTELSLR